MNPLESDRCLSSIDLGMQIHVSCVHVNFVVKWLGNDGEIVLELPRDDEGDEGHEDGDSAGGEGLRNEGGVGGKGKKKAKPHRFTAVRVFFGNETRVFEINVSSTFRARIRPSRA